MNFFLLFFLLINTNSESETVYYRGDRILFDVDSAFVRIHGNSSAEYGKLSITADTLMYYLKNKFLDARGNVIFNDGDNDIEASRMTYNVEKEYGSAYNARTEVESGWFYGDKIRYFEGKVLKIKNGYYTTCDLNNPHYEFFSLHMKVNIDRDLVAEPLVLLVRKIPLFFLPFYFQSLKKERSSGLITPSFGSSSYSGKYIEDIGWYQTLGPYADVTIFMDYYTVRGIKSHVDGRWKFTPYSDGNLNSSYIKERETGNERWFVNMNSHSRLPGEIKLNLYSDIASDNEYFSDYETGEVEKLLKDISYGGNISANLGGFRIYGVLGYRENATTGIIDKRWPALDVNFPRINLPFINLNGSSRFIRDETYHWASGIRGNANLGFNLFMFNMNLSLSGRGDYYEREDVTVRHWSSNLSVKTRIYGLSMFGVGPISGFRHVITPTISASYAPEPTSITVEALPGFSIPGGRRTLGIGLGNLFQCKIGDKKYNFASLSMNTNYKTSTDRFTPVSISGNFWIGRNFRQTYTTSYDFYTEEFGDKTVSTDFGYNTEFGDKPLEVDVTHRINFTTDKRIQQADMNVGLNVTPNWKVDASTHYDFERKRITRSRIKLSRDLHCWELSMSFNTFGDSWDYNFKIAIKDLPEVKLERGTVRTLMP